MSPSGPRVSAPRRPAGKASAKRAYATVRPPGAAITTPHASNASGTGKKKKVTHQGSLPWFALVLLLFGKKRRTTGTGRGKDCHQERHCLPFLSLSMRFVSVLAYGVAYGTPIISK